MRLGLLLLVAFSCMSGVEPGVVLSDGTVISGAVRMAPGAFLRVHDGTNFRTLDPRQVCEIRLVPLSERLVRAFAMPEPGKALRIETGEPYPLRELSAVIALANGDVLRGHIYATAVLIAGDDEDRKVILPAKQQGAPGSALAALVYPQRIVFQVGLEKNLQPLSGFETELTDNQKKADPSRLRILGMTDIRAVGLITHDTLAPLDAVPDLSEWSCEPLLGSAAYVAVLTPHGVVVGWDGEDAALHQRIATAVTQIRDYYDDKLLIAVRSHSETAPGAVSGPTYVDSIVRLVRREAGTNGSRNPWHVEIWRWLLDDGPDQRALLSARGTLIRGLQGSDIEIPQVSVSAKLWTHHRDGNTLVIGAVP